MKINFNGTVVFADNTVMSSENFLKKGRIISYKGNENFFNDARRFYDPRFASDEKSARRFERIQARKQQLIEQSNTINKQIAELE